jgi:hypothetical protein
VTGRPIEVSARVEGDAEPVAVGDVGGDPVLLAADRAGLADDEEGRFTESALVARPGYYHHSAEPDRPSQE